MWLLNTPRATLHSFVSPEHVPSPGFAILSHVWDANEQTFQDLQILAEHCRVSNENPRDHVCEKIRRCCELAEAEGYKWVWVDTCCIDKTSSAELSEAINSMFHYYSVATVCYAYLGDVDGHNANWYLEGIKWCTRGWTLQELIAPSVVVILSRSWTSIGTKYDLAEDLQEITGVPASVLRMEKQLDEFSVAQRMSWAAGRNTTRLEDEAYSLLGIFDINMPTLYGEGRRAFRRLQEEIMRKSPDTTLFAWGSPVHFIMLRAATAVEKDMCNPLFAECPNDFKYCHQIVFTPRKYRASQSGGDQADFTSFEITPCGVLARVALFVQDGVTLFNLDCSFSSSQSIPISMAVTPYVPRTTFPVPLYTLTQVQGAQRIIAVSQDSPPPTMTSIYLADTRPPTSAFPPRASIEFPCNRSSRAPFHFSFECETKSYRLTSADDVYADWTGTSSPAVLHLSLKVPPGSGPQPVRVALGQCTHMSAQKRSSSRTWTVVHWANVQFDPSSSSADPLEPHDCATDHICWPSEHTRSNSPVMGDASSGAGGRWCENNDHLHLTFRAERVGLELKFRRSALHPRTLVLWGIRVLNGDLPDSHAHSSLGPAS